MRLIERERERVRRDCDRLSEKQKKKERERERERVRRDCDRLSEKQKKKERERERERESKKEETVID